VYYTGYRQDTGYSTQGTGRTQDIVHRAQTGYRVQYTVYRVHKSHPNPNPSLDYHTTLGLGQDTGYRIQDTGYRIQDTGYRIQDTGWGSQPLSML
jgi:hypothetical protein